MEVFVVIMRRWGDPEGHAYVLGVFTNKDKAAECGDNERLDRAGKYEYEIMQFDLDSINTKYRYLENQIKSYRG